MMMMVLLVTMASMAMLPLLLLRVQSDKRIFVQVAELPLPLPQLLLEHGACATTQLAFKYHDGGSLAS